jgi:hypothetical protein
MDCFYVMQWMRHFASQRALWHARLELHSLNVPLIDAVQLNRRTIASQQGRGQDHRDAGVFQSPSSNSINVPPGRARVAPA